MACELRVASGLFLHNLQAKNVYIFLHFQRFKDKKKKEEEKNERKEEEEEQGGGEGGKRRKRRNRDYA